MSRLSYNGLAVFWQRELLVIPFRPKNPVSCFRRKGMSIFLSKKKPLLIVPVLASQQESEEALKPQTEQFPPDYAPLQPNEG